MGKIPAALESDPIKHDFVGGVLDFDEFSTLFPKIARKVNGVGLGQLLGQQFKELVHEEEGFLLFDEGELFLVDQGHQSDLFDKLVQDAHVGGYLVGGQGFAGKAFEGLLLLLGVDDVVVDAVNQSHRVSEVLPV